MNNINFSKSKKTPANKSSKLLSYATLASSFLLYSPNSYSQCGTANSVNPVLGIDIDGDGNNDLSIRHNTFITASPLSYGPAPFANSSIVGYEGIYNYPFYFPQFTTISGCPVVNIPNGSQGWMGVYYGATGNQLVTYFSLDTSREYLGANGIKTGSYIYGQYAAMATAYAGNQIVGLTGINTAICSAANNGTVNLGYAQYVALSGNYNISSYTARRFYREPVFRTIVGTLSTHNPTFCTVSASIPSAPSALFMYYPLSIAAQVNTLPGSIAGNNPVIPFRNLLGLVPNTNNTKYVGVKFKGPDQDGDGNQDNYVGWAEIFIHPDSRVTCLGTAYNSCSIEAAIAAGESGPCPTSADLNTGSPDPGNNCPILCPSMVVLSGVAPVALDQESTDWIQSTQTLPGNTTIDYDAVQYVELKSGFCAPANTTFYAFIDQCNNGGGGVNLQQEEGSK